MGELIEFPDVKQSRETVRKLKQDLEALLLEGSISGAWFV